MEDHLQAIEAAIQAGQLREARQMLKLILKEQPSADAWYLAALIVKDSQPQQAIELLRRALALDSWHAASNRLLYRLEGTKPATLTPTQAEWNRQIGVKRVGEIKRRMKQDRHQRHQERQRRYTRIGCGFALIGSLAVSFFALRVIGIVSNQMGTLVSLLGGPTPVAVINGTPLSQVEDAVYYVPPVLSAPASSQSMEILDAGYLHEHIFQARQGAEMAVYVQFVSMNANRVGRNVAVLRPDGRSADTVCYRQRLLKGDTNVAFTCLIDVSGSWSVRVLGRDTESVGAYFVGVQSIDDLASP
jgi:hypothetical protein